LKKEESKGTDDGKVPL